jgi:signal peptidase I
MKVGDIVIFESDKNYHPKYRSTGIVVAESPYDSLLADAFAVVWSSGEFVERVPPRILEVINEGR